MGRRTPQSCSRLVSPRASSRSTSQRETPPRFSSAGRSLETSRPWLPARRSPWRRTSRGPRCLPRARSGRSRTLKRRIARSRARLFRCRPAVSGPCSVPPEAAGLPARLLGPNATHLSSELKAGRVSGYEDVRGDDDLRDEREVEVLGQRAASEDRTEGQRDEHGRHEGNPRSQDPRIHRQSEDPVVPRGLPVIQHDYDMGPEEEARTEDPKAEDLLNVVRVSSHPRRNPPSRGTEGEEQILEVGPDQRGQGESPERRHKDPKEQGRSGRFPVLGGAGSPMIGNGDEYPAHQGGTEEVHPERDPDGLAGVP